MKKIKNKRKRYKEGNKQKERKRKKRYCKENILKKLGDEYTKKIRNGNKRTGINERFEYKGKKEIKNNEEDQG